MNIRRSAMNQKSPTALWQRVVVIRFGDRIRVLIASVLLAVVVIFLYGIDEVAETKDSQSKKETWPSGFMRLGIGASLYAQAGIG